MMLILHCYGKESYFSFSYVGPGKTRKDRNKSRRTSSLAKVLVRDGSDQRKRHTYQSFQEKIKTVLDPKRKELKKPDLDCNTHGTYARWQLRIDCVSVKVIKPS